MTEPVSSSLPTCRDLIQSIVAAVDARDVYTAHHSDRVAAMAVVLARALTYWNICPGSQNRPETTCLRPVFLYLLRSSGFPAEAARPAQSKCCDFRKVGTPRKTSVQMVTDLEANCQSKMETHTGNKKMDFEKKTITYNWK